MREAVIAVLMIGALGCDPAEATLLVQLRTDYTPGEEMDAVRVSVAHGAEVLVGRPHLVVVDADYAAGVQVLEAPGLTAGDLRVTVEIVQDGRVRAVRVLAVDHPGGVLAVTALITNDCEGVACPMAGDDAGLTQCVGGTCVAEGCSAENPDACPAPECETAADCAPSIACAQAQCADGVCLEVLDDAGCADGERCLREVGCFPAFGTCADDLDCATFEPSCLAGLGRRCAVVGLRDDNLVQLGVLDPDTGASCVSVSVDPWPGVVSGNPQLFGAGTVWASGSADDCRRFDVDFDTGRALLTPSLCGLPALLRPDELVWVESVDGTGPGLIHRPGFEDIPFSLPENWGVLFSLGGGQAALRQPDNRFSVLDLSTGAIVEEITAPPSPQGAWRDPRGGFLWATGTDEVVEMVFATADGTETGRVAVTGLPPLGGPFASYVLAGCAF